MAAEYLYLVTEGEQYYEANIPHVIFTDEVVARGYREQLISENGGVRWPNVYLWRFEPNVPGGVLIEMEGGRWAQMP